MLNVANVAKRYQVNSIQVKNLTKVKNKKTKKKKKKKQKKKTKKKKNKKNNKKLLKISSKQYLIKLTKFIQIIGSSQSKF